MVPYTKEVADYCDPFSCGDEDLDEFFRHDVFLYEEELLGKTYCRINRNNDNEIVAMKSPRAFAWRTDGRGICQCRL